MSETTDEVKTQELTTQQSSAKDEKTGTPSPTEQNHLYAAFWDRVIEESSISRGGEDPAYWPAHVLSDFIVQITDRAHIRDPRRAEFVRQIAPLEGSLRNVRTAYEILAYPQCKNEDRRDLIADQLRRDTTINERDSVTLNDTEFEIVRKICDSPRYQLYPDNTRTLLPKVPLDPQRRVFRHAEVIGTPSSPQAPQLTNK